MLAKRDAIYFLSVIQRYPADAQYLAFNVPPLFSHLGGLWLLIKSWGSQSNPIQNKHFYEYHSPEKWNIIYHIHFEKNRTLLEKFWLFKSATKQAYETQMLLSKAFIIPFLIVNSSSKIHLLHNVWIRLFITDIYYIKCLLWRGLWTLSLIKRGGILT